MDLITEQRLARRASILETARQMIAEIGYEAITVRGLADRCRVSVPTLYNQFGGKDELLGEAITLQFQGVVYGAGRATAGAGYERLLEVIDRCAEQLLTLSAYHQRLLEAFASLDQTAAVRERIAVELSLVIGQELTVMHSAGQLASWVETELLAEQLTTACISSAVVWSSGLLPDDHLLPAMRYATALVLAGVVGGAAGKPLLARLRQSQQQLLDVRRAADESSTPSRKRQN